MIYEYDGVKYPNYLKTGNACQFIAPAALQFCKGQGLDVGGGKWPLPGATCIDLANGGDAYKLPEGKFDFVFCARPGQRVTTPIGRAAIEKIGRGDLVLGRSGFVRVRSVCRYPFSGRLYRLETSEGIAEVTGNHPIATPRGWFDADHLRHSDRVFGISAKVQPSHFVNCGNILAPKGSRAPLGSDRSVGVSEGHSSSAKRKSYFRLPTLGHKKWLDCLKEFGDGLLPSGYDQYGAQFVASGAALVWRCEGVVDTASRQNFATPSQKCAVAIGNCNLGLEASAGADVDTDTAFAVDDPSQISPISQFEILHTSSYAYQGDVINLETDDGTFFLENILTHNSSHCLEHLKNPVAAIEHWQTRLKPGGVLFLYLPHPDMRYWNPTRNRKHLHEWQPRQMRLMLQDLGFVDVLNSERDLVWSFAVVGFTPPENKVPAPDAAFHAAALVTPEHIARDPQLWRVWQTFGAEAFRRSSAWEPEFEQIITAQKFRGERCVEIGTYSGMTAFVLARHFKEVVSLDIFPHTGKHTYAKHLGVKNVKFIDIKDNAEKARIIEGLDFDAAYVDGDHGDAQTDFNLVKRCGRVLFHEYWEQQRPVWDLVNGLRAAGVGTVEVEGKFALWTDRRG